MATEKIDFLKPDDVETIIKDNGYVNRGGAVCGSIVQITDQLNDHINSKLALGLQLLRAMERKDG